MKAFLVPLLGGTLFTSAFLLFWCQPMVGRMLLPALGGTPAVWTTCVLFFQAVLLLGYVYAHALGRMFDTRRQILIHGIVLLAPFGFLPIAFAGAPAEADYHSPVIWLMGELAVSVAVPFFAISATAPLLQNWLSSTSHASARDPYFLYAASNAGSLLALLAYPFLVEPAFGVARQTQLWTAGYAGLFVLLLISGILVWPHVIQRRPEAPEADEGPAPGWKERLFWIAAAFVPSALMLAVTNHITSNLGSAPFLWIVPLAAYLLTFILAFGTRFRSTTKRVSQVSPILLLIAFPFVAADVIAPPGLNWVLIAVHVALLYCGALLCHTSLAERRPAPRYLTEFYLWVSLAGVLGGIFTATLAPMLFDTVLEYPLLLAMLPFFRVIPNASAVRSSRLDYLLPAGIGALVLVTWVIFAFTDVDTDTEVQALAHTAFLFFAYKLRNNVRRFALAFLILVATYVAALPSYLEAGLRVNVERNFFGVKKISDVVDESGNAYRWFTHGDTLHGMESLDPARSGEPISYYHETGPVGELMDVLDRRGTAQQAGVLGLGAGTMATYGGALRQVTFYEIDPDVETAARGYFSFLSKCGGDCQVLIGDGRLRLAAEPDGKFDLLMLDAFSSDSVPAHLLSREALQLYLSKLKPDGILMFNVSNRYLQVNRLVEALVLDANLTAFTRFDEAGDLRSDGKSNSTYVVAARNAASLGSIAENPQWSRAVPDPGFRVWTDDYSNLLNLIRFY